MKPKHRVFITQTGIAHQVIPPALTEAIALYDKGEKRLKTHPKEGECLRGLLTGWDTEILAGLKQKFPHTTAPKGNDAILEKLYRQGKTTGILRSELHEMGFESDWKQKKIATKNHILERSSTFSYVFSLKKS